MSEKVKNLPLEEVAAGYWKKIYPRLPTDLTDQQKIWLENYLQAQVAVNLGDFTETRKILTRLDNEDGFLLFEERHPDYFATMDMVARGRTNRDRVKPLLTREDLNS